MRKFITILFSGFGIFCILYYCQKYYIEKRLCFEQNSMLWFTILATCIIIGLIISILNYLKLQKVQSQNVELLNKISCLSKQIDNYHYSEMNSIKDNLECILDLELDKGDN